MQFRGTLLIFSIQSETDHGNRSSFSDVLSGESYFALLGRQRGVFNIYAKTQLYATENAFCARKINKNTQGSVWKIENLLTKMKYFGIM